MVTFEAGLRFLLRGPVAFSRPDPLFRAFPQRRLPRFTSPAVPNCVTLSSMDAATLLHPRIDTSGKRPVVAGTRLQVSTIARNVEQFGMSVGEILEAYPHLTQTDVSAALAYFNANPELVRAEWTENDAVIAEFSGQTPARV